MTATPNTPDTRSPDEGSLLTPGRRVVINALAGIAAFTLAIGIIAPVMTLKKLVVVKNTFSLGSGLLALATEGHYLLFVIIGLFSVVFPFVKIAVLMVVSNLGKRHATSADRWLGWLNAVGKYSMLDVFVVAVLLATVKLGALATVQVHYGLYAFCASVLVTMVAAHLARKWLAGKTVPADLNAR